MLFGQTYRSRMLALGVVSFVAMFGAGLVNGQIARLGAPGENFWLIYLALLSVFAIGMAATLPWWRRLDDVQKSGHLVSWYWGGMIGGVMVVLGYVAATGIASDLSRGAGSVLVGQGAAFAIAWLIWRWRLRAASK